MFSSRKNGILCAAFVLVFVFFLIEGIFRYILYYGDSKDGFFIFNKNFIYSLKPNHTGIYKDQPVSTNSFGFRNAPISPLKSSKRIMVLGDSRTFGWGVNESETYCSYLNTFLKNTEVLNLGVPGYNILKGKDLLEKWYPFFKPDLVILAFNGANTHLLDYLSDVDRKNLYHSFLGNSRFYLFVMDRWATLKKYTRRRLNILEYRHDYEDALHFLQKNHAPVILLSFPDLVQIQSLKSQDNLFITAQKILRLEKDKNQVPHWMYKRLLELSNIHFLNPIHKKDIEPFVKNHIDIASLNQDEQTAIFQYQEILKEIAKTHQIPLIDYLSIFKKHAEKNLFLDEGHATPLGHKIIAEELFKEIKRKAYLKDATD